MSAEPQTAQRRSSPADAARIGRRLGVALFWVMCVYVIAMSTRSIVPALYFPARAPQPPPFAGSCVAELSALQRDISDAAAACVERGAISDWNDALHAWDTRFLATSSGCESLEPAREDLRALRRELDVLVRDYGRSALPIRARIRHALSAVVKTDPS